MLDCQTNFHYLESRTRSEFKGSHAALENRDESESEEFKLEEMAELWLLGHVFLHFISTIDKNTHG